MLGGLTLFLHIFLPFSFGAGINFGHLTRMGGKVGGGGVGTTLRLVVRRIYNLAFSLLLSLCMREQQIAPTTAKERGKKEGEEVNKSRGGSAEKARRKSRKRES